MKTPLTKIIAFCGDNPKGNYKLVADYAKLLLQDEQEHICNAFVAGSERGTKDIPYNCEQYYSQTFYNK